MTGACLRLEDGTCISDHGPAGCPPPAPEIRSVSNGHGPQLETQDRPPPEPPGDDDAPTGPPDPPRGSGQLFSARTLAGIEAETIEWVWRDRLPAGKLVMCDGDPGVSKSTLSVTIAAHISTGRAWPDGTACPLGDVLLLTAEDGIADTVRPRLDAAGGDPSRVHVLDSVLGGTDSDGIPVMRPPTLADVPQIQAAVLEHNATLCIVDVLMAYLPSGTDSHRDQDIRAVMGRIKVLAERTGCTFLFIRHLNKAGGSALYRGGGSIGISGAARLAWLVARDPDDEALIVLAQTKNNIAPMPPALSYRLVDHSGVGRVEWAGEVHRSADDLVRQADSSDDRAERDALAQFIAEMLEENGGEAPAVECERSVGKSFGKVHPRELKRAREKAGATTKRIGFGKGSKFVWRLIESTIESIESANSVLDSMDSMREPMGPTLPEGSTEDPEGPSIQGPGTFGIFVGSSQGGEAPAQAPAGGRECADCHEPAGAGYVRCPAHRRGPSHYPHPTTDSDRTPEPTPERNPA